MFGNGAVEKARRAWHESGSPLADGNGYRNRTVRTVGIDALNYLGKRLDGMDELEQKRFLAALSCEEAEIGYGLKNIINLTYNLEHLL